MDNRLDTMLLYITTMKQAGFKNEGSNSEKVFNFATTTVVKINHGCSWITAACVRNVQRLSLYEFDPQGQDLVSVVRIREGPYYREYMGIERCPYQRCP